MAEEYIIIHTDIGEEYQAELTEEQVVKAARAALLAEGLGSEAVELSVAVSGDDEVRRLNREYRGVDRTTDVLSFSAEEEPNLEREPELQDKVLQREDKAKKPLNFPGVEDEQEEDEWVDEGEGEDEENTFQFKLPPNFQDEEAGKSRYLGDIIISYPQAVRQAPDFSNNSQREAQELIIHGVFHLLGYDHEVPGDREIMRAKEEAAAQILDGKSNGF